MKPNTIRLTIAIAITIALGFAVVYNVPVPGPLEDKIPGWFFWGIGFVIELIYITKIGRLDPWETDPIDLLKFDIGMKID